MRLFTKTCRKDFEFLKLAIASVERNVIYPRCSLEWTFVCDDGESGDLEKIIKGSSVRLQFRIYEVRDHWGDAFDLKEGYIIQQWVKMNAHRVMGNSSESGRWKDYFLNWDSDVISLRRFDHESFMSMDLRPKMWITPYNHIISTDTANSEVHLQRQNFIKKVCGAKEVPYEYMRTMPIWMNSEILRVGSERDEWRHAKIAMLNHYPGISEFNLIGWFSHQYFLEFYEWRNTQEPLALPWSGAIGDQFAYTHQAWSWGPISEQFRNAALGK